ncbi:MAG: DNA/RNA helicase domain-containing protein, partial [Actinomycetota bacterium]
MHLYGGMTPDFIADATRNRIASKLEAAFVDHFRFKPARNEVQSWQNSLRAMADVVSLASMDDHGVVVELQLPLSSKRLDCLFTGHDTAERPQGVIVELKQWQEAAPSTIDDCVSVFVGMGVRDVLHPSRQVGNYERYLLDVHTTFSEGGVGLASCGYLHNMTFDPQADLFSERFADILDRFPTFTGDQADDLATFLDARLSAGDGGPVLDSVLKGRYRPHKRLLQHTARMIKGEPAYTLLDEQQVAFNDILGRVRDRERSTGQSVFLIRGGPGTGKSVIAVNLLAELSLEGFTTKHATGSKAFTENLRKSVGSRAAAQFGYFNGFVDAEPEVLDVVICDEAHRIRSTSANRYTPRAQRSTTPQIEELIRSAKVSVFFIDDLQVVRPSEVGSSELITRTANELGIPLIEHELETQFRCGGSEAFVGWVENPLELRETPYVLWDPTEDFEFDIVQSPQELAAIIR